MADTGSRYFNDLVLYRDALLYECDYTNFNNYLYAYCDERITEAEKHTIKKYIKGFEKRERDEIENILKTEKPTINQLFYLMTAKKVLNI